MTSLLWLLFPAWPVVAVAGGLLAGQMMAARGMPPARGACTPPRPGPVPVPGKVSPRPDAQAPVLRAPAPGPHGDAP